MSRRTYPRLRPSSRLLLAALTAAVLVPGQIARAAAVGAAWEYVDPDLEASYWHEAVCTSPDGGVLMLVTSSSDTKASPIGLRLSRSGEPSRIALPELPSEAGVVRKALACRWITGGQILLLVSTSTTGLAAIWLDSELSYAGWLALDGDKNSDAHPFRVAESGAERFILVGASRGSALVVRFDRRRAETLELPWEEDRERMLMDVSVTADGGFTVCGMETGIKGSADVLNSSILVASFDATGSLLLESRLPGAVCRLLPAGSGRARVLRNDAAAPRRALVLTTLDEDLEPVSHESLMTPFVSGLSIPSFELDGRLFFVNNWFAWETLEIRGPAAPESIDLDVSPGGVIGILPGPTRVYVLSTTRPERQPGQPARFGVRVDALDVAGDRTAP